MQFWFLLFLHSLFSPFFARAYFCPCADVNLSLISALYFDDDQHTLFMGTNTGAILALGN